MLKVILLFVSLCISLGSFASTCEASLSLFTTKDRVEQYKLFEKKVLKIADHYLDHPRFEELAIDPDHNNKITLGSQLEAVSGLYAENMGIIPGPILRGPKGTEFVDANGVFWDVKTPISPIRNETNFVFNPITITQSLMKKFIQREDVHILLDLSYLYPSHAAQVIGSLSVFLPRNIFEKITVIIVPDPF